MTADFLKKYRLWILLLVSAIITPPDVFSQIMVAIPLVALYEVSIVISGIVVKKREKEAMEA